MELNVSKLVHDYLLPIAVVGAFTTIFTLQGDSSRMQEQIFQLGEEKEVLFRSMAAEREKSSEKREQELIREIDHLRDELSHIRNQLERCDAEKFNLRQELRQK